MATKGITDRQRVAKGISATARTHAQEVADRLQEVLTPALEEGESLPDLVGFQQILARYLEMRSDAIVAAEEEHLKEQHDDLEPRRRRDEAAASLVRTLVVIRQVLAGAFGSDTIPELVGLEGSTASEPVLLLRQANRVLQRLQQPLVDLPATRLDGIQVDFTALSAHLQPALDDLTRAVQALDRELRETETSLRNKDLNLDTFDTAVSGIGRVLVGFDLLAGFRDYADKIRLTLPGRRRSNTRGDAELPPPQETPEPQPEPQPPPEEEQTPEIGFAPPRASGGS